MSESRHDEAADTRSFEVRDVNTGQLLDTCSWDEMCDSNADQGDDEYLLLTVDALDLGDKAEFGGGAAARLSVTRIA